MTLKRIGMQAFLWSLCFALLLSCCASAPAFAQSAEVKTVRVGYVDYKGYEEGGETGHKTGYGYEYLQRISYLAGWRYEYVYGNFSELFDMLQRGEIDLMGDISFTEERAERINYSSYPMSKEYYYLVRDADNSAIRVSDFSSLDGMTIAVTHNSFQAGLLAEWLESSNVHAEVLSLSGSQAVAESLESGKSDAIVITKTSNNSQYMTIANIGYSEVYFGVSKSRTDLLEDINEALYIIQTTDPMYNDKVTSKYASFRDTDMTLSEMELAYLAKHGELRIGYLRDYLPLTATGENGETAGLLPQLTGELLGILDAGDSLSVSYAEYSTMTALTEAIRSGEIDAGFPFLSDFWYTEQRDLCGSLPVASSPVSLVCLDENTLESIHTLAVTDSGALQVAYASLWLPQCEIIYCDSQEECLKRVLEHEADGCLLLSSRANYYLDFPKYDALHSVHCAHNADFSFEFARESNGLLMLFDRAISTMNMTDMLDSMNSYLPTRSSYSLEDFIQEHSLVLASAGAGISLLIAGLFLLYILMSRRIRSELSRARNEALKASEAKSTFLFNMSHDIRTPMNAIIGFNREAQRHMDDPEILKDSLDKVQSSSAYLLGIVNDVLDMSQLDSGNAVVKEDTVDLRRTISDTVMLLESAAAAKKQTLSTTVELRRPCVVTDELRLRQILVNVIDNAIKYTPEGGCIRFSAREFEGEDADIASYEFVTEDNGIGMSEDFQKIAFEAFTREKNSTTSGIPGTGLGLSIVAGYTKLMHGDIDMQSRSGEGTRLAIRFQFPSVEDRSAETEEEKPSVQERTKPLRGKRILIVEDNEINAMLAQCVLQEFGMLTDTAENGRIAIDKLNGSTAEPFDFVLMDIQMPVMDGYETSREIRLMDPPYRDIPIIGLSANAFESDRSSSLQAGMNAHLAKPMDVEQLADTLLQYGT